MNIVMIDESKLNDLFSEIKNIAKKLNLEKEEKATYTVQEIAKLKNISYQTAMKRVHNGDWKAVNETPESKRPTYRIYKDEYERIMRSL